MCEDNLTAGRIFQRQGALKVCSRKPHATEEDKNNGIATVDGSEIRLTS